MLAALKKMGIATAVDAFTVPSLVVPAKSGDP